MPVTQPARPVTPSPYTPSEINTALVNAGAPPAVAPTLTAISGAESGYGRSQISPTNKDGSRDHGVFQVNDKAWPFQNVAAQPLEKQAEIAVHIYNQQGLKAWSTYNNGAYKKYLDPNAPVAPAAPNAPAVRTSPAQDFLAAQKSGNFGAMLAALNKGQDDQSNKGSVLSGLSDTLNQGRPAAPTPSPAMLPQVARPPDTSGPSSQLLGQIAEQQAKPLSWSSTPFGSNAGPQAPGTTLNSLMYG
jgi:hypothetical protein